jgi:putative PIN family toxin of toxin-antitoxin system
MLPGSAILPNHKLRVFLDTNVFFSSLYSRTGAPGIIIECFIKGEIRVVISQQVLEEVIRTIKEKIPEALPALRRLLVSTPPELIADPELQEIKRWAGTVTPADAAFLVAAMVAQPDYFITGDNHFIGNQDALKETGLNIINPAQFLKIRQLSK